MNTKVFYNFETEVSNGKIDLPSRRSALQILLWGILAGMGGTNIACMTKEEIGERARARGDVLVQGLLTIHKVISRGLMVSLESIRRYESAGQIRAEEARGYLMYVSSLRLVLHGHHLSEDEVAFPYFRSKLADVPFDKLSRQHRQMASLLLDMEKNVAKLESNNADTFNLGALRTVLENLHSIWVPHIEIEERGFSGDRLRPIVTPHEQERLNTQITEHSKRNSGPGPLAIPFLIYNLEGRDRIYFLSEFPWVLKKIIVPVLWRKQWEPMRRFLLM